MSKSATNAIFPAVLFFRAGNSTETPLGRVELLVAVIFYESGFLNCCQSGCNFSQPLRS